MEFYDVVGHVLELLQRQKRVSYRALKRQFSINDDYVEDLKDELIYAQQVARDEDNRVLVWTGDTDSAVEPTPAPPTPEPTTAPATDQDREPVSYTPSHLAEKILQSKSALEGERKQVTVLFCDLQNSTPLAEKIGPENMHALLNHFFELALNEVHRYEGTINQFLGDGFMALFGAPISHEDHARRAVEKAYNLAYQGLELAQGVRNPWGVALAQRPLGCIAHTSGDFTEAETHLREARDPCWSIQARYELARTYLDLASLAYTQNDHDTATTHLSTAYAWFNKLQVPKWVEKTEQLAQEYGATLTEVEIDEFEMEGSS